MSDRYTLYHGDCLDILPTLEPGSVDAVIADIPYGTTACAWDSVIPFEPMWAGIKHVLKPRGAAVLFGSQPFTSALVMSNVKWFKYCWVWDKVTAKGHLVAKHRPMQQTEDVAVFGNGAINYYPIKKMRQKAEKITRSAGKETEIMGGRDVGYYERITNFWYPKNVLTFSWSKQTSLHPTQKPVALMEYLIRTYTNEGDTVLDFTMGSGSTGVAAMKTGRRFIGIELDPQYYAIAEQRIKNAAGEFVLTEKEKQTGQLALFG